MKREELITIVDKALYLSGEADELYEKFIYAKKRSGIKGLILSPILIFGSLFFIAPAFIMIGSAIGNETLEFLGNAYFDYYIFVLALVLPIYFSFKRMKKFKHKMIKTENMLIEKEERLSKITVIPENYKNSYALSKILGYLEDGRTNDLKESINLFVKEEQEERRHHEMMGVMGDISEQQRRDTEYLSDKISDIETRVRNLD